MPILFIFYFVSKFLLNVPAENVSAPVASNSSSQQYRINIEKTPFTSVDQALNYDAANIVKATKEYKLAPTQIKILKREEHDGINFVITTYPYEIGDDHTDLSKIIYKQILITKFIANGKIYSILGPALKNNEPIPQAYQAYINSFHFTQPSPSTPPQ